MPVVAVRGWVCVCATAMALVGCSGTSGGQRVSGASVTASVVDGHQSVTVTGTEQDKWSPATISAVPGSLTVNVSVPGGTPHNFQIEGVQGSQLGLLAGGQTAHVTVTLAAGIYRFVCTIHSGMEGTIVVSSPTTSPSPSASAK